jgi:hypothetical protein
MCLKGSVDYQAFFPQMVGAVKPELYMGNDEKFT